MPRIIIKSGTKKGEVIELKDEVISVGREPSCAIQLLEQGVSRVHAEIFRVDEMCFIRDLNSLNGTFVNDEKVDEELLSEGDLIRIGQTVMTFRISESVEPGTDTAKMSSSATVEVRFSDIQNSIDSEHDTPESQRLNAMYRLFRLVNIERSLSNLKMKATSFFTEFLKAENIFLYLRDPATGKLNVELKRAAQGEEDGSKLSMSIVKHVASTNKAVLTSDAGHDARFKASDSVIKKNIESVICVPILERAELKGMLYLENSRNGYQFTPEDLHLAQASASLLGSTLYNVKANEFEQDFSVSMIRTMISAIETKQTGKPGHSERVANYCCAMALQVKLSEKALRKMRIAGLLHDVGKLCMKETDKYEDHSAIGERIVRSMIGLDDMAIAIRHHHEKVNGSGFPAGLVGEDIPMLARIIGVADRFDRLISRGDGEIAAPHTPKEALRRMESLMGKEYHEKVVKALISAYEEGVLTITS